MPDLASLSLILRPQARGLSGVSGRDPGDRLGDLLRDFGIEHGGDDAAGMEYPGLVATMGNILLDNEFPYNG